MSTGISFSRFTYFDTNILSILANEPARWRPLQDFLYKEDLCIAVSGAQVAELSNATWLHESLNELLTTVPSVLIKTADVILDEEINAHPHWRVETLMQYPLNALYGKRDFAEFLASEKLTATRRAQRETSKIWMKRLVDLRSNFLTTKSGKYNVDQADFFAWILTIQQLSDLHNGFLGKFKDNVGDFKAEVLLSAQILGYALFYKYYLGGQTPEDSDFCDMFHLHAMPYCKLVVVEKNMCSILNQVKHNHKVLDGVVVKNLKFLKDWKWEAEEDRELV